MRKLNYITKYIKGYLLAYVLLLVGLVFYIVFSVLTNTPKPENSVIPSYSLNQIGKTAEDLDKRSQIPPFPEASTPDSDFGKEEPFR